MCSSDLHVAAARRRHDEYDRLIDGCQTQPGRQVQRFKESALRFAPAQLSRLITLVAALMIALATLFVGIAMEMELNGATSSNQKP